MSPFRACFLIPTRTWPQRQPRLIGGSLQLDAPPPFPEPEHHAPRGAQPLLHPPCRCRTAVAFHHRPAVHGRRARHLQAPSAARPPPWPPARPRWPWTRRLELQQPLSLSSSSAIADRPNSARRRAATNELQNIQRLVSGLSQADSYRASTSSPSPEKSLHSSPIQSLQCACWMSPQTAGVR